MMKKVICMRSVTDAAADCSDTSDVKGGYVQKEVYKIQAQQQHGSTLKERKTCTDAKARVK